MIGLFARAKVQCAFTGTKEVRYGAHGVYVSLVLSDGTACDNNVLGDPIYGYPKGCDFRDVTSGSTTTTSPPTLTPNGGSFSGSVSVAMQSATSESSIYYTTDGSTPTQSSNLYSGAVTLTSNATVKATAFKSGLNPSATATATFTNGSIQAATLSLSWQDNSDNEDNFQIERKTGTSETYIQIALAPANSTSYSDSTLIGGTVYFYRVVAINSTLSSRYSNEVCDTAP